MLDTALTIFISKGVGKLCRSRTKTGNFCSIASGAHRPEPYSQFLRKHDRICRRVYPCMIVIECECSLHTGCACGSLDPLRVLKI